MVYPGVPNGLQELKRLDYSLLYFLELEVGQLRYALMSIWADVFAAGGSACYSATSTTSQFLTQATGPHKLSSVSP